MFVRWKRRQLKKDRGWDFVDKRHKPAPVLLSAVLVESVRIDGKPRQRIVRYLGSIHDAELTDTQGALWRRHFWTVADRRLADMALADAQRVQIVAQLEDGGARPTDQELDQRMRERQAALFSTPVRNTDDSC